MTTIVIPEAVTPMERGRIEKALRVKQRYEQIGVLTRSQRLAQITVTRKSFHVRRHETHKRDGCYPELKNPVTEYSLWYADDRYGGHETGMDVPKVIYDLVAVPERETG